MKLLLDRRGDQIVITEKILSAFAANLDCGATAIELLLDRRGDQVVITEEVLLSVARNVVCGTMAMELLLDRRGDQVVITEEVLLSVARNEVSGTTAMELLLDQRADQVVVTENILCHVLNNVLHGKEMLLLLLDRRRDQIVITENVLMAIAKSQNPHAQDLMELLLDRFKDRFLMTREAVMANPLPGSEIHDQARAWILRQELEDKGYQARTVEEITDPILITKKVIEVVRRKDLSVVGELEIPFFGRRVCRTTRVTNDAAWFEELLLPRLGDRVVAKEEHGHAVAYHLTRRDHDGKVPPPRSKREDNVSKKFREFREEAASSEERGELQVYIV